MLSHEKWYTLLSDEGPVREARYDTDRTAMLALDPLVKIITKSPLWLDPVKPMQLVLYATPNGNTAAQTIGRPLGLTAEKDDWRYGIQNIGAQTHWIRENTTMQPVVVYLEPQSLAWPAWRKQNDANNARVGTLLEKLHQKFPQAKVVLTGHSGGGSFTFGVLDFFPAIPDYIQQIAFLDSNYGYDATKGHAEKLTKWLQADPQHRLHVLAYKDYVARLQGKAFVSENGGTWGRSQAMVADLKATFGLKMTVNEPWETWNDGPGQIEFRLHRNPESKILHTVLVEQQGFVHALTGLGAK